MEFDRFEIYEKQDSKYKHHRTVYKGNEWTRKYILCDKKKRLSIHHAYFGLGSFFDTAKQFDIQDEYENKIGSIQGYFFTCCPAEFYFYKENGELFGVAQLDPSWAHLTVKDANEDVIYTCDKTFHFNVEEKRSNFYRSQKSSSTDQYHWTITYDDRFEFDSRFFWPFLCFISEVWWPGITE